MIEFSSIETDSISVNGVDLQAKYDSLSSDLVTKQTELNKYANSKISILDKYKEPKTLEMNELLEFIDNDSYDSFSEGDIVKLNDYLKAVIIGKRIYNETHVDLMLLNSISSDTSNTLENLKYDWFNVTRGNTTNSLTSGQDDPYLTSNIYSILNNEIDNTFHYNESLSYFYNRVIRKTIHCKKRYYSYGDGSKGFSLDSSSSTDLGKFWIPSEYEIMGCSVYGIEGLDEFCIQYPYFKQQSNRIYGDGRTVSPHEYFTRTLSDVTDVVYIDYNGIPQVCTYPTVGGSNFTQPEIYLPICFRVGVV